MATFLAERYWPGVTAAAATVTTATLRASGVEVVETIVVSQDEVCLWYLVAASAEKVTLAFAAAAVPVDRIGPATRIEP